MKSRWFGFLILTLLLSALAAPALAAQSTLIANVPFAFVVNHATLPAGSYLVEEENPGLLLIRGDSGSAVVMAVPNDWNATDAKMVFQRYGDKYVLEQVYASGERWDVSTSRSVTKLAKAAAPIEIGAAAHK